MFFRAFWLEKSKRLKSVKFFYFFEFALMVGIRFEPEYGPLDLTILAVERYLTGLGPELRGLTGPVGLLF